MTDVAERLEELRDRGLYRRLRLIEGPQGPTVTLDGQQVLLLCSNNYLGLADRSQVREAAADAALRWGASSGASRLISGNMEPHRQLEQRLAAFKHYGAALLFGSGYLANTGVIAALAGRGEVVFSDELNHASIVDGCRLSAGVVHRYPHGDLRSLERELARTPADAGKLIVTDGIFSMEGNIVDLPGVVALAEFYGAEVMVDDAHSFGVLGEFGGGTAQHFKLEDRVSLIMATFSKSLASIGGMVAGPEDVIHFLKHHSRALIFSASMPPASVAGTLAALDVIEAEPERRERLWHNARRMQEGLKSLGYDIGHSETPIIPVNVGDLQRMLVFWKTLFDAGVFTNPVTPPAVPDNACRLRVSVMATHTDEHVDFVLDAFAAVGKQMALI